MDINLTSSVWKIIILAAVLHGFLLSIFLISTKSQNQKANFFLALHVLFASLDLFFEVFYTTSLLIKYPGFIGVIDPIWFLYGPLLFFYVHFLINPNKEFRVKMLLYFIPALTVILVYIPFIYTQSNEIKLIIEGVAIDSSEISIGITSDPFLRDLVWIISCIYEMAFVIEVLKLLKKHKRKIKQNYSRIDKLNLNWLRNISLMVGIITVVSLCAGVLVIMEISQFENIVPVVLVLFSLLIYIIGYMGLKQPVIFSQNDLVSLIDVNSVSKPDADKEKYLKSKLKDDKAKKILKHLTELMISGKIYTNENLMLKDLAGELEVSAHDLSQVLNIYHRQSFYDFINSYRLEEAKRMLLDKKFDHYTILGIAFESGFNSKSSFYNAFKKQFNISPSEFRKRNKTC